MTSSNLFKRTLLIGYIILAITAYPTFDQYIKQFGKDYKGDQYDFRKGVYEANIANFVNIVNWVPGVNKYTDWTETEIKSLSGLKQTPKQQRQKSQKNKVQSRLGAPTSLDWRSSNIITSIKDQGSCGACWAFSSAALMEAYLVKAGKQSLGIDLSQQFILECSGRGNCAGGYFQYGLDKIKTKCATEGQYSYTGSSFRGGGICSASGVETNASRVSYFDITDTQMINLLQQRPVGIAVDSTGWSSYSGSPSILQCSTQNVDHAVIVVGYTPTSYIIKNSWGTSWGSSGYGLLTRDPNRNCGALSQVHSLKEGWGNHTQLFLCFLLLIILIVSN